MLNYNVASFSKHTVYAINYPVAYLLIMRVAPMDIGGLVPYRLGVSQRITPPQWASLVRVLRLDLSPYGLNALERRLWCCAVGWYRYGKLWIPQHNWH